MKSQDDWKQLAAGVAAGIREGSVAIPYLLLRYYHKLKLTESDAMLIIHLITFMEKEKKEFPTIEEIQLRMTGEPETVITTLERLLKEKLISIDEETDPVSEIRSERYNLNPLYEKLAECRIEEWKQEASRKEQPAVLEGKDIFSIFEMEFARPLTPMEMETISIWIDREGYKQELILAALKEAVFAGKVHFRYIDRILLEWSRNRVFTVEQAKEHTQKFRGAR